ncbi:MAG TPA: TonB family protein [Mucilaginibacter sp.]|nr:TonB family protein [Mucilaginibacter sp.]
MSKTKDDISQIKKYLEGKLDDRAMHELERRALDDPFLADAMEGYERSGTDQQANLDELAARLHDRTDKKVRRLILWGPISIAASVLIILGIGVWVFTKNDQQAPKKMVAAQVAPGNEQKATLSAPPGQAPVSQKATADTTVVQALSSAPQMAAANDKTTSKIEKREKEPNMPLTVADNAVGGGSPPQIKPSQSPVLSKAVANADIVKKISKPKDSVSVNEVIVQNVAAKKQSDQNFKSLPETLLNTRVEGVSVTPRNHYVSGIVTGADGLPITGATVKLAGANFGAITDANGKFALHNVPDKATLSVGYLGYQPKQVNIENKDSLNITLNPSDNTLSEVVVVKPVNNTGSSSDAHPSTGWQSFNDYLKNNTVSPDGKTGIVNLSFTVDANGNLSGFKVTKSLSDTADQKAIDLVKNGPDWIAAADKMPHEVKVTVKFH